MTNENDIPLWARGLHWFLSPGITQAGEAYPIDFGILQDVRDLQDHRRIKQLPFQWAKDLWARVYVRCVHASRPYDLSPELLALVEQDCRRPRTPPRKRARVLTPPHAPQTPSFVSATSAATASDDHSAEVHFAQMIFPMMYPAILTRGTAVSMAVDEMISLHSHRVGPPFEGAWIPSTADAFEAHGISYARSEAPLVD